MRYLCGVILLICLVVSAPVLAVQKNGGLAVSYVTPQGDYDQVVSDGGGASAIFDYPFAGIVNLTGSMGWYSFRGRTLVPGTNIKTDSTNLWEFSAGPQVDFGVLYLGVEGGYYTNLKEWGLVPNVGIRKGMIDLGVRYKVTDDGKFMAVRAGFFF